jgi:hypothetical protein
MPVHRSAILVFLVALLAAGANARLVRHLPSLPAPVPDSRHFLFRVDGTNRARRGSSPATVGD